MRAKHLVLVGATGMVGGYALRYALDDPGRVREFTERLADQLAS